MSEVLNVEKIFNQNVFTLGKMKERLPRKVFNEVKNVMDHGGELSLAQPDVSSKSDEGLGSRKWCNTLYSLVSATYRCNSRKA